MKPFNLEQALAGAPVRTRDGRKVTEVTIIGDLGLNERPITARVEGINRVLRYTKYGEVGGKGAIYPTDLMMGTTWPSRPSVVIAFFSGMSITYLVTELLKL